ncbi:MAG: capsular biosynthesis protein [Rhodobacteraceae bacterium]|nr:capsular biosynthesis protein [Paracoccaceae bacterium]
MIVLPMAGLGSRFTKAGFNCPKYMLPLAEGTMFSGVVQGFENCFDTEPFLFIVRQMPGVNEFIATELRRLAPVPSRWEIAVLDAPTSGQAETVYKGLVGQGLRLSDTDITIFNIDTRYARFTHPAEFSRRDVDGYLDVVMAAGDHWSFVRPECERAGHCRVAEVAEKRRISQYCSTGLYHFRQVRVFCDLYEQSLGTDVTKLPGRERYVAPLYNMALSKGMDIRYRIVDKDSITFTGTPGEYFDALGKHGLSQPGVQDTEAGAPGS